MKLNEFFGNRGNKKENIPSPNPHLESLVQSLKGIPGPEFIARLREIKKENSDFGAFIENYKGDKRLGKDILNGLFFLEKETKPNEDYPFLNDPNYLRQIEEYYYPENTKKERRRSRAFFGTYAGILGGLAISIGVGKYMVDKDFEEQQQTEKTWIKDKIPLSLDKIEQQADTIFKGLSNNIFLYEAKDTLNQTVNQKFTDNKAELEMTIRNKITDCLDSMHSNNPELFKSLVLEYWKSKNNLPSNYYEIAGYPKNADREINEYNNEFEKAREILEQEQKVLLSRIQKAYENAGGNKIVEYSRAVEEQKSTPEISKEKTSIDSAFVKFSHHIDSLTAASFEKYASIVNSPLSEEVKVIQDNLDKNIEKLKKEEEVINKKINQEQEQKIQVLRNNDAKASGALIETKSESFKPEVWAYLEDYYLVNEAFNHYNGIRDTASENELKVLAKDLALTQSLNKILTEHSQTETKLSDQINEIKAKSKEERDEKLQFIRSESDNELAPTKQELLSKKSKYETMVKEAVEKYNQEFKKVWNEELKKQNISSIKPLE